VSAVQETVTGSFSGSRLSIGNSHRSPNAELDGANRFAGTMTCDCLRGRSSTVRLVMPLAPALFPQAGSLTAGKPKRCGAPPALAGLAGDRSGAYERAGHTPGT
jgi:hypothetical protein